MIAQLVENFVHLESGRDRFDQYRGADGPLRNAQLLLRKIEDIVPDARLEMALPFREVKVRPAAARDQFLRVVEEVEAEIDQPTGRRFTIHQQVFLNQMPAAWPNEKNRDLFVERIFLPIR